MADNTRRSAIVVSAIAQRTVASLVVACLVVGCGPSPFPSTGPTASAAAVAPSSDLATPRPSPTPEPTPQFVRFDIQNGQRHVIVWITSDRGANAVDLMPGDRRTIVVQLSEGTNIEVYGDECERIASIDWLPGASPATITLTDDGSGTKYLIDVRPGVSGAAIPPRTGESVGCSG